MCLFWKPVVMRLHRRRNSDREVMSCNKNRSQGPNIEPALGQR